MSDGLQEFGSPGDPVVGGVRWNGSVYLDCPFDADAHPVKHLLWRVRFDFVWVLSNLITILDKESNRPVRFVPNRPQLWALWNLTEQVATGRPGRLWCLKGRQFGFSTLWTVVLFICTSMRGLNSLLLAHREAAGKTIFSRAETSMKSLPTLEVGSGVEGDPVQVIRLVEPPDSTAAKSLMGWIGSGVNAVFRRESAENRDIVGETYQCAQLSETPLYADAAHTLGHFFPALSHTPGTIVVGEFTARGEGDYTHNVWVRSVKGEGIFRAVFAAWYWHLPYVSGWTEGDAPFSPEELEYRELVARSGHEYPLGEDGCLIPRLRQVYAEKGRVDVHDLAVGFELSDEQLLFRRRMIDYFGGDMTMWQSEFPFCPEEAFATAARKLIPPNVMDKMDGAASDPLPGAQGVGEYVAHTGAGGRGVARWMPRRDGRVQRFELPQPRSTYLLTCDPSSGAGADPTGIQLLKVSYRLCEVVAEFEGFERPYEVARILARIGRHYRDEMERDPATKKLTGGRPCEIGLERNGFGEHVIHELVHNLRYTRVCRYTDRSKDNWRQGHDYGFPTTKSTKMPMLQQLAQACYDGQIRCPARRSLQSLRAMQYLDDQDSKVGAPKGQHDDLGMALGVGFHFASLKPAFRFLPREDEPVWLRERVLFPKTG